MGEALRSLRSLATESVHCVVTSPPYWGLRDYGVEGQIGLEQTPWEFLAKMVEVFREIRRVLRSDGTCWVNMGDSYAGSGRGGNPTEASSTLQGGHASQEASMVRRGMPTVFAERDGGRIHTSGVPAPGGIKAKDLIGMPWRLAFALQDDGWYLRQDIIWAKPNPMPESVTDRCTKSHEYVFLFSKSETYFFDAEAIKEKASTNSHTRGGGVNPKAKREGQHSRMRVDRDPRHTKNTGVGWGYDKGEPRCRKDLTQHAGHPIQRGFAKLSSHNPRAKQNESFSGAVNQLVTHRNKRSVWTFATAPYKKAHFATFPPTLPRICIKAGTSAHGCCAVCGRPFNRIVERYDTGLRQKVADGWDTSEGSHGTIHREGRTQGEGGQPVLAVRTIGWETECCALFGAGSAPCRVLDPFAGAGTTGLVALEMGREPILIELNPEYIPLIHERLGTVKGRI